MTHILLNIKYRNRESILTDDKLGEKLIIDWTNFNEHVLVKRPLMHVFPSTYVTKKNEKKGWDVNLLSNLNMYDNYSYVNENGNDLIETTGYNGYTGLGLLGESHISIHTYPEKNCIHIDFFSCRKLDSLKNSYFVEKMLQKNKSLVFDLKFIDRTLN